MNYLGRGRSREKAERQTRVGYSNLPLRDSGFRVCKYESQYDLSLKHSLSEKLSVNIFERINVLNCLASMRKPSVSHP